MSESAKSYKFSTKWENFFRVFQEYSLEKGGDFELGERTTEKYLSQIKTFVKFIELKELPEITKDDVQAYIYHLNLGKHKRNYVAFVVASIKAGFYLWNSLGLISQDPIKEVNFAVRTRKGKRKKREDIKKKSISPDGIRTILETIDHCENNWDIRVKDRDWLICAIAYCAGVREFELANIYIHNIDFDNKKFIVNRKGDEELEVFILDLLVIPYKNDIEMVRQFIESDIDAKASKFIKENNLDLENPVDIVKLDEFTANNRMSLDNPNDRIKIEKFAKEHDIIVDLPDVMQRIKEYIAKYELQSDDKLFSIKEKAIWYRVKHWIKRAHLDPKISTHYFRHSYGTHLGAKNISPFALQALMNHRDIKTTQRYVQLAPADTGEIVKNMNLYSPKENNKD